MGGEIPSLVTSKASFESSASKSGSLLAGRFDDKMSQFPSHTRGFVFSGWRVKGSLRFRLFSVVRGLDYLRFMYGAS